MSFKCSDQYIAIKEQYPNIDKILQRQLPNDPVQCPNCSLVHTVPNRTIKCVFQSHQQSHTSHSFTGVVPAHEVDSYMIQKRNE